MKVHFDAGAVELIQGNIVSQSVDAIVNAANTRLAVGGGVCGAIHRAAGPTVEQEIEQKYPDGCPTGSAVATGGGELPARWIFHAVGPVWRGGHAGEATDLRSAYRRCLELAAEHKCQTIAFPAISAGIYGYPIDLAAEHALDEVRRYLVESRAALQVRFVLFDLGSYAAFARVLESMVA